MYFGLTVIERGGELVGMRPMGVGRCLYWRWSYGVGNQGRNMYLSPGEFPHTKKKGGGLANRESFRKNSINAHCFHKGGFHFFW